MRGRQLLGAAAMVLLGAALSGCGSASRQAGSGGAVVEVHNNLIPPTPLTVTLLPQSEAPRLLGTVAPSATEQFTVTPPAATGTYRLRGSTPGGRELVSQPFAAGAGETVRWDVQANFVHVRS